MTVKTSAAQPAWEGYGGFWIRFLAYLVDSVILFIALILVAAGSAFLGDLGGLVVTIVYLVGPLLYWSMMHASARQATYGKALLGLKVTDGARKPISFVRSLARELAKIISAIPLMIGFILAGFTRRKQGLHDFFASTTVMREGPSHIVAGLAIGVLGWVAPVALIMVLGVGMFMGAAGGMMGGDMMAEIMKEAERQAGVQQQRPMPPRMPQKPPAPQVAVKPAAPTPPPPPAPVQVAAATTPTPPPAPVPTSVAAKPEPKPVVEAKPEPIVEPKPKPKPAPVAEAKPKPRPATAKAVRAPEKPMTVVALPPSALPEAPEPKQSIQLKTASDGPKYNDLMTAVLYGDSLAVSELLAFGKWADKPDRRGVTPLMAAAMLGDLQNAEALLKAGAEPGRALPVARDRGDGAMMTLLEKYQHR